MTSKTNIIAALEKEQMTKEIPDFSPGDTVVVQVKVKEALVSVFRPLKVWYWLRKTAS